MFLIDTNVTIYLRDANVEIVDRISRMSAAPSISILSCVELEAGVHSDPSMAADRRIILDSFIELTPIIPFDASIVSGYSNIIATRGFSRTKIIDRLIAATAIVHGLTLITINAADFRDIPGLTLESWPAPGQ